MACICVHGMPQEMHVCDAYLTELRADVLAVNAASGDLMYYPSLGLGPASCCG